MTFPFASQRAASSVATVASVISLSNLLEGKDQKRGLEAETDPDTGKVVLPDTEDYGQYLDEESWSVMRVCWSLVIIW